MIIRRLIFAIIVFFVFPITVLATLLMVGTNKFVITPIKWIITGRSDSIRKDKIVKICVTPLEWIQRKLKVEL